MPTMEKLDVTASLTEQAHYSIKRYILTGNLDPEYRLTEEFFAKELGISKSPVREALNALQNEGLLRIEPRKGTYLHRFTPKEIADLYELREALEVLAASVAPITPGLVDALQTSVKRTKELLLSNDKTAYIEEDIAFHQLIVNAAKNAELSRVHRNIQDKLWLCRCQTYQLTSTDTPEAHEKISQALIAGDRDAAQAATRDHIRFVRAALVHSAELANR